MKKALSILAWYIIPTIVTCSAAEIPIANPSFEDPVLADGGSGPVNQIPGWVGENNFFQIFNPRDSFFPGTSEGSLNPDPLDGVNAAAINVGSRIYQDLNANLESHTVYTLTAVAGDRLGANTFGTPSFSLWAGGQRLAEVVPAGPGDGNFTDVTLVYEASDSSPAIGLPLRIQVESIGGSAQVFVDNFRLTTELGACSPHGATAVAQIVNGFVVGATVTDSGCGYTNAPSVTIAGGGGSGATAEAVLENGRVTGILITDAGCCYTNAPVVLIESPPFEPTLAIQVSQVEVIMNVRVGISYVLESTTNFVTWEPTGPPFIPTTEHVSQKFDVETPRRFYRIRQLP